MGILKDKKLVMVHIPKTAGVAIQKTLNMKALGHYKWSWYDERYPDHIKFSVIRNPYDRFISSIFYAKQEENEQHGLKKRWGLHPDYLNLKDKSIKQICYILKEIPHTLKHPGFDHQYKMICDDEDRIRVNYLLRYERLQQDFDLLCKGVGLPIKKIEVWNTTKRKHYDEHLTDELKEIVYNHYKKDFELFNYSK